MWIKETIIYSLFNPYLQKFHFKMISKTRVDDDSDKAKMSQQANEPYVVQMRF